MGLLLNAKDLIVSFPAKCVLDGVTLGINEGDRVGVVGRNGDGKSTLLAVLAGLYKPDEGEVTRRGNCTIGMLGQEEHLSDELTVGQVAVGEIPTHTWAADSRTREIIDALVADVSWTARLGEISGGQRRRVVLAGLLIQDWDILMLDEPTNHLDIKSIAWLAEHLKQRWAKKAGALLVVTHDRWFLDEVASTMWEVVGGKVESFEGGFSAYIQQRAERQRVTDLREEKRRNLIRKELAWLSRGARARSTKPKFHVKAALELIEGDPPLRNTLELKKASMTRLGKQVLELNSVTKSFGKETVLDEVSWLIGPGDRFGILGENGTGKTTFLRLLTGEIDPTSGNIKTGQTVKMACLTQRLEELEKHSGERVRQVLGRHKTSLVIEGKSVSSSQLLERLGFEKEHLQSFVEDLSGGQRRRLQLLLTLLDEPNVLLLDEPDNDMDIDMLAALEDLLDTWPGTLLLVSHDRHLLERVADDQFALIDNKVRHLPGGIDEYLSILERRAEKNEKSSVLASTAVSAATSAAARDKTREGTLSGADIYQLKKELKTIERKLSTLERKSGETTQSMHDADPSDYQTLINLEEDLKEIQARTVRLESSWLEIMDQLEET